MRAFARYEEALFHFNVACALEPGNLDAQWERSSVYLQLGRFKEGWEAYDTRCELEWMKCLHLDHLRWDGKDFQDKTVLLCAEQGYGDTILCSRYIPLLKERGGRVVLVCEKSLHRLFQSIRGVDQTRNHQ